MNASILYDGSVVSIDNLYGLKFSFRGFLVAFFYKGEYICYCDIEDVRENQAINGYYYSSAYTKYVNNVIKIDELVKKYKFDHFE